MKRSQTLDDLNEDAPHFFLLEVRLFLLVARNLLEQVTPVGILHHNAARVKSAETYQSDCEGSSMNASW